MLRRILLLGLAALVCCTPSLAFGWGPWATFSVSPKEINKGETVTATWQSSRAKTVTLEGVQVPLSGAKELSPTETGPITLIVYGRWWAVRKYQQTVIVKQEPPPPPPVPDPTLTLVANPTTIQVGNSSKLSIACSELLVVMDQGIGEVALTEVGGVFVGSITVSPIVTTIYNCTAVNEAGTITVPCTVTVGDTPPPPIITTGLHVLIVEEVGDRITMPVDQLCVLLGRAPNTFRGYCEIKCPESPEGLPIAVIDQHLTPRGNDPFFAQAFERARDSLPWIVVANETTFWEGPLWATNAEAVAKMTELFGPVPVVVAGPYQAPKRVIDETNAALIFDPPPGKSKGYLPRITHPRLAEPGSAPDIKMFGDVMQVIPRQEWPARIKAFNDAWAWPSDYEDFGGSEDPRCRDQNGTNYCWANAPSGCVDTIRRIQGLPFVEVSAASIGGPITGYRNVGGWGIDAVEYLADHGGVASAIWPNNAISSSYNTARATADRKNRMAFEWVDLQTNNLDQLGTAMLLGHPCCLGLNWWSHEIKVVRLVEVSSGVYGWEIRNSWGTWGSSNRYGMSGFEVLSASKSQGDAQMLRTVTDTPALISGVVEKAVPRRARWPYRSRRVLGVPTLAP